MLIVGVLCLAVAIVLLAIGARSLIRPSTGDPEQLVLRAVAPTQLAAGIILGVGAMVMLTGPPSVALLALIIGVTGALGTLAAGFWQGARYAALQSAAVAPTGCGAGCGCAGNSAPPEPQPEPESGCGAGCGCAGSSAPPEPEPATGCGAGCGCS